jgi:hypothetical protein
VTFVRGERQTSLKTGKSIPWNILSVVRDASRQYGVPEWVLIAVLQQENSSFNPKAINKNPGGSVDYGIAQINDFWRLPAFGGNKDALIACANDVSCAIDYLAQDTRGVFENERRQPAEGAPESDDVLWLNAAANWHTPKRESRDWSDYRERLSDLTERGYIPSGKKDITPDKPKKPKAETAAQKRLRAPSTIQDVYDLFDELLGRAPESDTEAQGWGRVGVPYGVVRADIAAGPEAALWRQYGPRIKDARSWANSIFRQYTGNEATNAQMRDLIDSRYTPDTLEAHMRAQPGPGGQGTLGQIADVRDSAAQYARQFLGRRPDEGEINWLATNFKNADGSLRAPTADEVSGFYEQLKTRMEKGDPSFAWVADPQTWRDQRDSLQRTWESLGLRGKVDPRTVNDAISGKWSDDETRERFEALPAPGYPEDYTVGEVNRVRAIAQPWKKHYYPGEDVTREEIMLFRGVKGVEGNEAIRHYYRSLPADWAGGATKASSVTDADGGGAGSESTKQHMGQDLVHRFPQQFPWADWNKPDAPVMEQGKEPSTAPKGEPDIDYMKRHLEPPVMRA